MDLSDLSLADLRTLQERVKQEISKREHQEVAKAREQIIAIAQRVGIPLKDLMASPARPRDGNGATTVRYRHPSDKSLRWSGRGRKPKWIKDWVESGQPLDALRL